MDFIDIVIILMCLSLATAIISVVWSKMRSWRKTVAVSVVMAVVVGLGVWALPDFIDSDDQSKVWIVVADVFLTLITIAMTVAAGSVVWSLWRTRKG